MVRLRESKKEEGGWVDGWMGEGVMTVGRL